MIKPIRQLISDGKSGHHIGQGNKYYGQNNYEEALEQYKLAVQYQKDSVPGVNPLLLEYLAMTYAKLGDIFKALTVAEQSRELYRELDTQKKQFIVDSIVRIDYFIELLRKNNNEDLNKYLSSNGDKE